ncbi:methyltransferase domain-containing protein [Micromonospora sp. CPCC 206061]|uniref:methyltransferase domain-containing protein n=1 Tax=Micromonospora sp. CPCC 206061 TaxID=3122410 RepID=UPI002FF3F286
MVHSSDSVPTHGNVTDKAFTTYDIQACLYDAHRVEYLRTAIHQAVRPGDVVVDAGSGTGLLGMLAAQAGAARVYCLELNPEFIPVIEQNARRNGLSDRVIALNANATTTDLPEGVDVLISEVISAGFFFEPQLQIVRNLLRFLKPGGRVVPMQMKNYVELLHAQEELYGLKFTYDSRFTELDDDRSLTSPALYLSTDFLDPSDERIDTRVRVTGTDDGVANAVKITYDIEFADGVWADKPTEFLLNPQIIFLPTPVRVRSGADYDVTLDYLASDSPLACRVDVFPAGPT